MPNASRKNSGNDVCDSKQVASNSYRIPGARAQGKDNHRERKGTRRKGQRREENLANCGDQSGVSSNYQHQDEFGSLGGDKYQDVWGIRPWMFTIRGEC